jgi:hypothetical protein
MHLVPAVSAPSHGFLPILIFFSAMKLPVAIVAVFWAAGSYVIYLFLSRFLTSRRNAAKARELKCEDPPFQKNRYPLGIDQVIRAVNADKAKLFPLDQIQRTLDTGAITYKYSVLGNNNIFTADEKNIQAILATQFNDFDLGPHRRGNFWPLLGNGIFTQGSLPEQFHCSSRIALESRRMPKILGSVDPQRLLLICLTGWTCKGAFTGYDG